MEALGYPRGVDEPLAAFVRDEEIWFSDGNVVLEAEGYAFKVYQGLLAHNSEVFRNLFSIPQPRFVETEDDCPLIRLSDHPAELRHFLRVLFPGERSVIARTAQSELTDDMCQ